MLLSGNLTRQLSLRQRFLARKEVQGFTQIELAITVLVVGVLAAIAAPSFQQWQQQRKVDQAVIILDNAIRETQTEAVKRSQNCEIRVKEGFNPQGGGAIPLVSGNCLISTIDLAFVGVQLRHNIPGTPERGITFNAKGEIRNPPNNLSGPFTASFSVPNTNVRSKCIVLSVGIGLRRKGQLDQNLKCVTS
jgi:prepilin-type N-terminal cleavage/methylation domain-containing protein